MADDWSCIFCAKSIGMWDKTCKHCGEKQFGENDEYYHLFSSGFAQKNDAGLVQSSISQTLNLQSEIITIIFPPFSLNGNFNSDEKRAISSALALAQTYYNDLYDISISLDTNITNLTASTLLNIEANFQGLSLFKEICFVPTKFDPKSTKRDP